MQSHIASDKIQGPQIQPHLFAVVLHGSVHIIEGLKPEWSNPQMLS